MQDWQLSTFRPLALACTATIMTVGISLPCMKAATRHRSADRFDSVMLGHDDRVLVQFTSGAATGSGWKLVRSTGGKDGESTVSIMKTADALNSDPDFAGLMLRCSAKGKIDVLVILIQPYPPQSQPRISIGAEPNRKAFKGSMAAGGLAVVLPDEAVALAAGEWQRIASLPISIKDADTEIKGLIAMDGLRPAYGNLVSNCPP